MKVGYFLSMMMKSFRPHQGIIFLTDELSETERGAGGYGFPSPSGDYLI